MRSRPQRGFTLLEAMLLMVILSVVCLAVGTALQSLVRTPVAANGVLNGSSRLVARLEQLRAGGFDNLAVGTSGPDANGVLTTIATADPNLGGSPQPDFKQVTVALGARRMVTYIAKPN